MPEVLIDCPSTGKPIETGIALSKQQFESTNLRDNSIQCPHCRQIHAWGKEEAYLKEEKSR